MIIIANTTLKPKYTLQIMLNIWKQRILYLKGKIIILKNIAVVLNHASSVVGTPDPAVHNCNCATQ